ncbi:MAG: hypothetical protein COB58_09805 [Thalassobium sp.]|jgi:hypothetical protein|nr:MAG: hypothetical protein COB43_12255 [Oceanospirillales bacterium]PHQ85136.1 MAG: hypothetical protein COB58_09805 [Thalassobium sp.]
MVFDSFSISANAGIFRALQMSSRTKVSLRASTCSTRRKYIPVGLTPASMLATVVQAATRMQAYIFASLETEREKVYE